MSKCFLKIIIGYFCLFLLCSCGISPDKKKLQQEAKQLVNRCLIEKIQEQIEQNPECNIYKLGDYHIVIISGGILSYESDSQKMQIDFFRKYDVVEYELEAKEINIGEFLYSKKHVFCDLSVTVKETIRKRIDARGVTLSAFSADTAKNNRPADDFFKRLPSAKYDLFQIMETDSVPTSDFIKMDVKVKWNDKNKCWENESVQEISLKLKKADWQDLKEEHLKDTLQQAGFYEYQKFYFSQEDITKKKKYAEGFLLVDGEWLTQEEYEKRKLHTKELKAAIEKYEREKFGPFKILSGNILVLLKKRIECNSAEDEIKEKADNEIKQHPDRFPTLIPEVENMISGNENLNIKSEKYIKHLEALKQQDRKIDEILSLLDSCQENMQEDTLIRLGNLIKGSAEDAFYFMNNEIDILITEYLECGIILMHTQGIKLHTLSTIPSQKFRDYCSSCRGAGSVSCSYCSGTRRCHLCNGTGRLKLRSLSNTERYTSCSKTCSYCKGGRCLRCSGRGYFINIATVKSTLKQDYKKLHQFFSEKKIIKN